MVWRTLFASHNTLDAEVRHDVPLEQCLPLLAFRIAIVLLVKATCAGSYRVRVHAPTKNSRMWSTYHTSAKIGHRLSGGGNSRVWPLLTLVWKADYILEFFVCTPSSAMTDISFQFCRDRAIPAEIGVPTPNLKRIQQ